MAELPVLRTYNLPMSNDLLIEIYPTLRWYWQPGNSGQEELLARIEQVVAAQRATLSAAENRELLLAIYRLTSSYQWADGGAEQREVHRLLQETCAN